MTDINKVIAHYVGLRDKLAELDAEHKQRTAPIKADMETIENALQKTMQDQGVKSLKGAAGTAYLQERTSAKVSDWEGVVGFIKAHDAFDLLERRVAKAAVLERREAGEEVPGVDIVSALVTNVRRS